MGNWNKTYGNLASGECFPFLQSSDFQIVVRGPATPPENLLEMQIIRVNSRLKESENLGVGSSRLCFNKPSRRFWGIVNF